MKQETFFPVGRYNLNKTLNQMLLIRYYMFVKCIFNKTLWLFDQQLFVVKGNVIGLNASIMQFIFWIDQTKNVGSQIINKGNLGNSATYPESCAP